LSNIFVGLFCIGKPTLLIFFHCRIGNGSRSKGSRKDKRNIYCGRN